MQLRPQRAAQPRLLHVASAYGRDSNLCRQGFYPPRRHREADWAAACACVQYAVRQSEQKVKNSL